MPFLADVETGMRSANAAKSALAAFRTWEAASWSRLRRALKAEDGQALVEIALVLPVFVVVLYFLVQTGVAFNDYLRVTDAARVAAREAAVARFSGISCDTAAQDAATKAADPLDVTADPCKATTVNLTPAVEITVRYTRTITVPLLSISADIPMSSTATERLE